MRLSRSLLVGGLTLAVSTLSARAATIYVNAAATGSNDGSSWSNAYTSLQSGLAAAISADEIWVAAATYRPTATADRTVSFPLKNGVGIYGGFNGTETMRDQRNPAVNVTILSGDIGTPGDSSDNSYHVVTADSTVTTSGVLDGFTITGGNASGSAPDDRGGGMSDNGGAPTIGHCVFSANSAQERGGGLRVTNGMPVLDGCVFQSNSAAVGGGGVFAGSGSTPTVKNTIFQSNTTVSTGGGGLEADSASVVNSTFLQNSGNGALFLTSGSVSDCTFAFNSSYGVAFDADGSAANTVLWGDAVGEVFVGIGTITVTYSDVQGSFFGPGNINADPLFVNAGAGNLRLGAGSPAVDAGNNAAVPAGITTDLAGQPRFFDDPAVPDTGAGTPPIVDMGAYERIPGCPLPVMTTSRCVGSSTPGLTASVPANASDTYNWTITGGAIDSGQGTNAISFTSGSPGTLMTVSVDETNLGGCVGSAAETLQVDFNDVPSADPFYTFVCTVGHDGITAGCGAGNYCPGNPVTRAQMAVFLLRGEHGSSYTPPPCAPPGLFGDVACPGGFAVDWIEQLSSEGITAGCGGGNYCPDNPVTRAQMAVFLLRAEHGSSYAPPTCNPPGIFGDVPCPGGFAVDWIEQLSAEGVTGGCSASPPLYCPDNPNTRGQMAVFLVKALNLP